MSKKRLIIVMALTILMIGIPKKTMLAQKPPRDFTWSYSTPKDFIRWLNKKKETEPFVTCHQQFIKSYKEEQGYVLAPQIKDAVLDDVSWEYTDLSVYYGFHNKNTSWRIYVYPIKDCKNEYYYSDNILELVSKKRGEGIELNKKKVYEYRYQGEIAQESCTFTEYYVKKKLQLGNQTTVECVQENYHKKYYYINSEVISVYLHFFIDGMYVWVNGNVPALGQENKVADALRTCTFEKFPTNPRLTLEKKKNKVSKKNAILHATLHNPTNQDFTHVELYLYDKKQKRYRIFLKKTVTSKSMRKEKVALKFNVQKIIKNWRKRSIRRNTSSFPLTRKKKYKYKLRTKVYGKYLEAKGSFKLK